MRTFFLLLIYSVTQLALGQSVSNGPSTVANNAGTGTVAWTNVSNVTSSDDIRTTTSSMSNGNASNFLVATGFSFNIPTTAIVIGITVNIQRRDENGSGNIKDDIVKLVINGTPSGTDLSKPTNWSSTDADITYGSSLNTWGNTLTYSTVNNSNFGVAISAKKLGGGTNAASIDYIDMTVYYNEPLPIELLYLITAHDTSCNELEWATASETNNDYFTIWRSNDALKWTSISKIAGAGNSIVTRVYKYKDFKFKPNSINYYKLEQTDFDGKHVMSEIVFVDNKRSISIKTVVRIIDISGNELNDLQVGIINILFYDDGTAEKIFIKY